MDATQKVYTFFLFSMIIAGNVAVISPHYGVYALLIAIVLSVSVALYVGLKDEDILDTSFKNKVDTSCSARDMIRTHIRVPIAVGIQETSIYDYFYDTYDQLIEEVYGVARYHRTYIRNGVVMKVVNAYIVYDTVSCIYKRIILDYKRGQAEIITVYGEDINEVEHLIREFIDDADKDRAHIEGGEELYNFLDRVEFEYETDYDYEDFDENYDELARNTARDRWIHY